MGTITSLSLSPLLGITSTDTLLLTSKLFTTSSDKSFITIQPRVKVSDHCAATSHDPRGGPPKFTQNPHVNQSYRNLKYRSLGTEDNPMSVKDSILAKFQKLDKDKEEAMALESSDAEDALNGKGKLKRQLSKKPETTMHTGLSEQEVGITEYITATGGFTGILKHRFSDFQVHEIDVDGNLVELTSMELPPTEPEDPPPDYKSLLTEDEWEELAQIMESSERIAFIKDVSTLDKEERRAIHKAIRYVYGGKVCANTIAEDDRTVLKVVKGNSNRDRMDWPKNQGRFLHFTVFKENMDTTYLVSLLSRKLGCNSNHITYAGTKDKRGKTTQKMCIKNRTAERLHNVQLFKVAMGNYKYCQKPLRLGDLSGNKFTLAIRNVVKTNVEVDKVMNSLNEKGFINYFGLQRFGSSVIAPTYSVGKSLILEQWEKAIELILKPKEGERSAWELVKACKIWWQTKNAALALKILGKKAESTIEGKVLRALKTQGNNHFNSLFAIPRNTMLLYLHAYQSLVWNKLISRRIREFGLKPIAGDLVLVRDSAPADQEEDTAEGKDEEEEDAKEFEGNDVTIDDDVIEEVEKDGKHVKVRKLTSAEAEKTSLEEVVYPLPGTDVEYPDNVIAQWYHEILSEDGVTLNHFKNSNKAFSLYGTYRKIIGKVTDLKWETISYGDYNEDLILSDVDKLKNKQPEVKKTGSEELKAVIMDFKLKPATYATMVLREVMKTETSCSYHAQLTKSSHTTADESPSEKKLKTESDEED